MKKFFSLLGFLTILSLSFFYTEKIVDVVKEYDDIMIQIKKENDKYKTDPINSIIKDNTIIPGIKGKQINIEQSYSKMKRYGKYNDKLIIYEDVTPELSITNNFNQYVIGGNSSKMMVSLIFLVNASDDIDEIIKIVDKKNIKVNFFVDGKWVEENNDLMISLINNKHIIGNLSYNRDYLDSSYVYADTIIKKIGKQNTGYCYNEIDNNAALKLCSLYNNYTIRPNMILKNNYIQNIKSVKSGDIISFEINKSLEDDLNLVIDYIKSKGLKIENLNTLLKE
ncbi:MAG: polysaccharide deacetylase family protein [Bacilli bacterium]|nr:polysaccharide deacetylase family protein [Bacilli bacterium]